jgi:hypothetical protein
MSVSAGQWRYHDEADRMTGKTAYYAQIESDNSLNLAFPYAGKNHGTLTVRRHPKYGVDVLVRIERGQILCRSTYDPCSIAVKFGDGQPRAYEGLPSADGGSVTVFLGPHARFIAAAQKSRKILVQLPLYQAGEQVLEFTSPVELVWKPGK